METDPTAVRNFKDFLQLYNKMTEMCFQRCVNNLNSRKLDQEEVKCVEDCSQKFVSYNNKLMQNFVMAQNAILNKRVKEAEVQQTLIEHQERKEFDKPNLAMNTFQDVSVSTS